MLENPVIRKNLVVVVLKIPKNIVASFKLDSANSGSHPNIELVALRVSDRVYWIYNVGLWLILLELSISKILN